MDVQTSSDLLGLAAAKATARVPTAAPSDTAERVRGGLAGQVLESADEVAVLEGRRLIGVVPIESLFAAEGGATIESVMDADPPAVGPESPQEAVARKAVKHTESSIAVLDGADEFVGFIPAHRLVEILLDEHDEDIARLGGYLASTKRARTAADEPVARRLWHRLPWLMVGLIGAMGSALIVGAFEEQLETQVLLAFFVPAVVYMADAVGTQTETVLIRGLAVGVTVQEVLRRELATGLLVGLLIAAVFFPFALIGWDDADVALAVSLALVASCAIATAVAMVLPWALNRLGRDPAFGSGPVATIIQDLLSIAVYLAIATTIAT
ncbi:MAG TPA: magnesium transporter [Solirubrobacterales bacterium]|nr:magnesium transporter [Solirubrobacterales bacterium]